LWGLSCFGQDNATAPAAPNNAADAPPSAVHAPKPMSEQPLSAFEELGASFALSARLGELDWNDEQFNAFVAGLSNAFHHRHEPFDQDAKDLYLAMAARIQQIDKEKVEAQFTDPKFVEAYMRKTRRALSMQETDSGLCYMIQGVGGANRATPNDTVVVTYDVTASDLATSLPKLGAARVRVKVSDLMPGLAEGIQMMTADSKGVFLIPPQLSYGTGKWPEGVAKNEPLIFRVTLHEVDAAGAAAPSS
ncbi:MAG TPA: FKBP-type peptidyl-prolyl cis-trans isomerase, partial [Opitutaceae bacterium]